MQVTTPELERILDRVHAWIRTADQKAYILVLLQTGVPTLLAGTLKDWYIQPDLMPYRFPIVLATLGWLTSLVCSTLVVVTRTSWKGRQSVTFFGSIDKWSLEGYRSELNRLTEDDLRDDYIDQIWISARICSIKHFFLKLANYSLLGSSSLVIGCYVYRGLRG